MTTNRLAKCILTSIAIATSTILSGGLATASEFTDNSLFWKVSTAAGAESYVFGTIHLPDTLMFRQRDVILPALENSKAFYAELDLDSLMTSVDPMSMMLPQGKTLADYYTKEELKELRAILKERLGPMAMMAERMKPAAIAMMAMVDDAEPTAPTTIDQFLWAQAKAYHVPVKGIESISEQLAVLDSIPPRAVLEALKEDASSDSLMNMLLNAYATENLKDISRLVDSVSSMESFMQVMNDDRNTKMADRLVVPLRLGGAFIAVGAAHLGGSQGLLKALETRGFRVEPVMGGKREQWLSK